MDPCNQINELTGKQDGPSAQCPRNSVRKAFTASGPPDPGNETAAPAGYRDGSNKENTEAPAPNHKTPHGATKFKSFREAMAFAAERRGRR